MPNLLSPGTQVNIIDSSIYTTSGTTSAIPLILMATASNKLTPDGTAVAPYTTSANAGELFLATSARELNQAYGNPTFAIVEGTPNHADETNEWGLYTATSFLNVSNRAYVIRADLDTAQLKPSTSVPRGAPLPGTYYLDLNSTVWGLFKSNGNSIAGAAWESQTVTPITVLTANEVGGVYVPKASVGNDGDFAIVTVTSDNKFYEKISGAWYEVGSTAWNTAKPTTVTGANGPTTIAAGQSFVLNGQTITVASNGTLAGIVQLVTQANIPNITAQISNNALVIHNTLGGAVTIANATGTPLSVLGIQPGTYNGNRFFHTNDASYPSGSVYGDVWLKGSTPNRGANWIVKYFSSATSSFISLTAPFYPYSSTLSDGNTSKDLAAFAGLGKPTTGNVYVGYDVQARVHVIRRWNGTFYEDLAYEASVDAPTTAPAAGTYYYNVDFQVDVMVGNGQQWNAYRRRYPSTDPEGVIISGSAPTAQSDGTPLVTYDLWLDSSQLESYPLLYRYDASTQRWTSIDLTDQTTPFGIVFADARQDSGQTFVGIPNNSAYAFNSTLIADMLLSDYVDPDTPDPRTYPDGMLLFNTRYSTYNVKQWQPNYFLYGNFDPNTDYTQTAYNIGSFNYEFNPVATAGRWVTVSGNRYDGAPYMGRKAQRIIIVRALISALANNPDVLTEIVNFNLIACPGYTELISEMNSLSLQLNNTAFVVGDTPSRLVPNSNTLVNWANNTKIAPDNGDDGLVTGSSFVGIYYPWGLTTDLSGNEIMIPPSSMALNVYAYNDQVAYPWLAPAGFNRGLVQNATSVGYLTSENEFKPCLIGQNIRDAIYPVKINPISYIQNRGIVIYGQKTLDPQTSSLDRVNVSRLACYLSYQLNLMMKQFLMEQNDQQTRDSVVSLVSKFLTQLIKLNAIEDGAVECDLTNNTADRRDNNELWVDCAIIPVKSIEYIYIPLRFELSNDSTGAVVIPS